MLAGRVETHAWNFSTFTSPAEVTQPLTGQQTGRFVSNLQNLPCESVLVSSCCIWLVELGVLYICPELNIPSSAAGKLPRKP